MRRKGSVSDLSVVKRRLLMVLGTVFRIAHESSKAMKTYMGDRSAKK
jgi:hypothetical protein